MFSVPKNNISRAKLAQLKTLNLAKFYFKEVFVFIFIWSTSCNVRTQVLCFSAFSHYVPLLLFRAIAQVHNWPKTITKLDLTILVYLWACINGGVLVFSMLNFWCDASREWLGRRAHSVVRRRLSYPSREACFQYSGFLLILRTANEASFPYLCLTLLFTWTQKL